jgi:predicted hotdog family 3-hydroxylacyl-ACP dehydratase
MPLTPPLAAQMAASLVPLPDRAWIAAHIPHQGSMCLLDAVLQWDANEIVCRASSHHRPDHPLRTSAGLGISAGIEYAAQAMAVHGALLAGTDHAPASGYLASVRNVAWTQPRLDTAGPELCICAQRISGNESSFLYAFSLHAGAQLLLQGRASVLQPAAPANPPFESEPT